MGDIFTMGIFNYIRFEHAVFNILLQHKIQQIMENPTCDTLPKKIPNDTMQHRGNYEEPFAPTPTKENSQRYNATQGD